MSVDKVEFFDYPSIYQRFKGEFNAIFEDVCSRGAFILQRDLKDFEVSLQEFTGIKHVIGVNDGTNAMIVAMNCIGMEPEDEVIISAHTYIATAAAVRLAGAKAVCADIDHRGLLSGASVANVITPATRAIMPTQLNGECCDMSEIADVAARNDLMIFEDSAQGLGAKMNDTHAGGFGAFGTLSFYPAKLIGCFGDGGAILTNDDALYEQAVAYRDHGRGESGVVNALGTNARLDNLQAAFLALRLRHFDEDIMRRREIASYYNEILGKSDLFRIPRVSGNYDNYFNVFQNYEIEVEDRNDFQAYLNKARVGSLIQWGGVPIYNVPSFEDTRSDAETYENTDRFFDRCIMLPIHMGMTDEHLEYVGGVLRRYIEERAV